jgi:predicted PhzF superfamily epimerase YddE/YHI9
METAFGVRPVKAVLGIDLICIFEDQETVRDLTPNQNLLMKLDGRIQNATARGVETDCVSRSFCPKLTIPEDPVCGSAHCQIADYWSKVLGKDDIVAEQASKRGGTLHCHLSHDGRIQISGEAVLFAVAEIQAKNSGQDA